MRHLIFILGFLAFCFSNDLVAQDGWEQLFNGKDFSNFEQLNGEAIYKIENEEMVGISIKERRNSFMATKKKYGDFILEFEVLIENGLNSGVQFRSISNAEDRDGRVHGYQCEIETSSRKWAGGIYDEARRGWLYPLSSNPKGRQAFVPGEWNKYRIEAIGPNLRTWVNGVMCSNLVDDLTSEGIIAFQVHGIGKPELEGKSVKWKNINIKTSDLEMSRLPVDPDVPEFSYLDNQLSKSEIRKGWRFLWDGETTEGWRGAKSESFPSEGWVMQDGVLSVAVAESGAATYGGDIITEETYSNFELSIDFKITEGSNSGIKYFVDPDLLKSSGAAIGLEFQILDDKNHPDAAQGKNGNRTVGSLYDLIRAENKTTGYIGKNFKGIGKWNTAKIKVNGGHVEHWLNNVKIVEYDRFSQVFKALVEKSKYEKYDNFGQLTSGHILLQDHGGAVSFRDIKIREF